jgi:hypothetical protein
MEKYNELSQTNKSYFKRKLNFNFAISFDIIIFILLGLTQPLYLKKNYSTRIRGPKTFNLLFFGLPN